MTITIETPRCDVCGIVLPDDRVSLGTCSRGCRNVLRRIELATATGDREKLESALAAGAAIRAEKADELREQSAAIREELLASRPDLAELAANPSTC